MKKIILLFITLISVTQLYGQVDKNGNPVFNSVSTNEKSVDNFLLISNYYTLKNNIESKTSSVFVSENPTLAQVENAAITLASDFFILTRESKMVVMVILQTLPKREMLVIDMSSNQHVTFPCILTGDMTENRAKEIVKERYDSTAFIDKGKLTFNGKEFQIISNEEIEAAVLSLIKQEKLNKKKPSKILLPSKNELKAYILAQTKPGGQLDFFTAIKGKEFDGVKIKPGLYSTKQGVALYKWGRACFDIGVNTVEDVYEIYSEFKQKEINQREKDYLKLGFTKELEK